MRPIPAPRLGDSHGLLRAISERERMRLDEFVTDFQVTDLFPPDLENALGRTRQFVSYARSAGLLKEDRGTVELTEIGKRYVKAGDAEHPFDVSEDQAEWLMRQLREKHMTDSIYHGLAIGLSLLASVAPGTRIAKLDFGRALGYLGRAGWDNENTLQQQGERYITLLADMGLIDEERALTPAGRAIKGELTLPVHMSLVDIAANLNPGGADAVRTAGEAEWEQGDEPEAGAPPAEDEAAAAAEPASGEPAPAVVVEEEDEYEDVGPGEYRDVGAAAPAASAPAEASPPAAGEPAAAPSAPGAGAPGEPASAAPGEPAPSGPAAAPPPTPPADVWDTAAPDDPTRPYASVETPPPAPAEAEPAVTATAGAGGEPAPAEPAPPAPDPAEAEPAMTSGDPLAAGEAPSPPRPGDAATVISSPPPAEPPPAAAPPPAPAPLQAGSFLDPNAIRGAAEAAGLRLPAGVYANVAAALAAGKHVVLTGPPGAGKTALALAIAKAAATSGRSSGAVLVTAAEGWSATDTLGRPATGEEPSKPGHVVDAARRGKWLVIDELDRAQPDRALGALSTFLDGLPVTIAGGEEAVPADGWRLVATAESALPQGSAALLRRFAHVAVPVPADDELDALIQDAASGDAAAAGAARRLLALRELRPLGAGVFRDAARHAAERNAIDPADEATLAREAYDAYVAPLVAGLDEGQQLRLRELVERL